MPHAIVIPGRLYGPAAGLLMYSAEVAERRGAMIHRYVWTQEPPKPDDPDVARWVSDQVAPVLDSVGGRPLLIAKSLGTYAAGLAAQRSLPAVWLTPLLMMPPVATALARAAAPMLLVGGTADPAWDGALAHRLSAHVLEVEDADHGMHLPGPLTDSITVLGRVVVAVETFLDAVGWPG